MSKLKFFCFFLLVLSTIYILMPFINGLGCNFTFKERGEHVVQVGKCKSGVLTAFYKYDGDGKTSYNRYIYGVLGNTFYLIRINKERVVSHIPIHPSLHFSGDEEHAFNLYDGDRFYISRYFCVSDKKCFVITDDAIENIHEMVFDGRLGFY